MRTEPVSLLARPLLHTAHVVTFAALFVTGLLLFVPDLRALATGGYSLLIRQAHCWTGVAFVALPVLLVLCYGPRSLSPPAEKRTLRTMLKGAHVVATVMTGGLFTLSGFVLWGKRLVSDAVVDISRLTHDWLTYAVAVLLAVHLVDLGVAALVARVSPVSATVARRSQT